VHDKATVAHSDAPVLLSPSVERLQRQNKTELSDDRQANEFRRPPTPIHWFFYHHQLGDFSERIKLGIRSYEIKAYNKTTVAHSDTAVLLSTSVGRLRRKNKLVLEVSQNHKA
jgi:hypothetical protein